MNDAAWLGNSIKTILSLSVVFGMVKFTLWAFMGLRGDQPLWRQSYSSAGPGKRRREILVSYIFGAVLLGLCIASFTFAQDTADDTTHLMGIVLGITGVLLTVNGVSYAPRAKDWQIRHVALTNIIRRCVVVVFGAIVTLALIFGLFAQEGF